MSQLHLFLILLSLLFHRIRNGLPRSEWVIIISAHSIILIRTATTTTRIIVISSPSSIALCFFFLLFLIIIFFVILFFIWVARVDLIRIIYSGRSSWFCTLGRKLLNLPCPLFFWLGCSLLATSMRLFKTQIWSRQIRLSCRKTWNILSVRFPVILRGTACWC